jgi:hypothetical protein
MWLPVVPVLVSPTEDELMRRATVFVLGLCMAALLVACGADGDPALGPGEHTDEPGVEGGGAMDADERERVAELLRAQGLDQAAEDVVASDTEVTTLGAPYLTSWSLHRFDRWVDERDVQHVIAVSEDEAVLLRAAPEVFVAVLEADGVVVDDPDTAVAVTRDYLFATRPTDVGSYLVDSVEDIRLRTDVTDEEAAALRDELQAVEAPTVERAEDGALTVRAFVVEGDRLVRREVTFVDGALVGDDTEVVARDLPVPFTL